MKLTCQELRDRAWNSLTGKYWSLIIMLLVFAVISGAAGSFTMGLLSLLTLPMSYALSVAFLNVSRTQCNPQLESMFTVYRDNFLKAFLVPLLQGLFVFLWSLLFVIYRLNTPEQQREKCHYVVEVEEHEVYRLETRESIKERAYDGKVIFFAFFFLSEQAQINICR